jgi:1-phosphofructokinase
MIVTLTLNPSLDYVMELPDIHIGAVNRSSAEHIYPGGKGINVSLMLQKLGIENRCLGFTAGDTGDMLVRLLEKNGLKPEFVDVKQDAFTRINVKIQGKIVTELNGNGPTLTDKDWLALFKILDTLSPEDILVISGRFPSGSQELLLKKVEELCLKGVHLVADSSGEALRALLALSPMLIKPNHSELEELCGKSLPTLEQRIEAAKQYWSCASGSGAQRILLSMGGEGALLFWDDGSVRYLSSPHGEVINTVAAGDSMLAGCLAGMSRGCSPDEILRLSVGCGSATAFSSWLGDKPVQTDTPVKMQ